MKLQSLIERSLDESGEGATSTSHDLCVRGGRCKKVSFRHALVPDDVAFYLAAL